MSNREFDCSLFVESEDFAFAQLVVNMSILSVVVGSLVVLISLGVIAHLKMEGDGRRRVSRAKVVESADPDMIALEIFKNKVKKIWEDEIKTRRSFVDSISSDLLLRKIKEDTV